jgi:nucleotide-binding universal stress UspA family protein
MKILAAVDESEYLSFVLKRAFELAAKDRDELSVITVINVSLVYSCKVEVPNIREMLREGVNYTVKQIEAQAEAAMVKVNIVVEESTSPANAIISYAEKNGIDLIVIGSKGAGAIQRFFVGSVSQKVVTHAPCSVYVVKK